MAAKRPSLKTGHRYEFVCLQIDIAGHSKLVDAERILHAAKQRFHGQVGGTTASYPSLPFKWEGDGGAFLFPVTNGCEFDEAVLAGFRILSSMPGINDELRLTTGLTEDLSARISLDAGTATYDKNPGLITGDFLNAFLKHERAIGRVGVVSITERVHRQLSMPLRGRFADTDRSEELGCRIYRSVSAGPTVDTGPPSETKGFTPQTMVNTQGFPRTTTRGRQEGSLGQTAAKLHQYVLVLSATISEIDKSRAEAIVAHLRELSGDAKLTLLRVEEGSVKLILEGSREGFERIEALFQSGQLAQVLGIAVVEIREVEVLPEHEDDGGSAAGGAEPELANLTRMLSDEDPSAQVAAATALWRIGPDAREAVPALIDALRDEHFSVLQYAAGALGGIGPDAREAVPELIRLLKDEDPFVRQAVAVALRGIGPDAREAVPELIRLLKDEDPFVRQAVAVALGGIGPDAREAVPELIRLPKDEGPFVRQAVAVALKRIDPMAVPRLIGLLGDEDPNLRGNAAAALGGIGPDAQEAVPELIRLLKDEDPFVRSHAAAALGRIGPVAMPRLIGLLGDEDPNLRGNAAAALGGIGPDAQEAVPELIRLLKDEDPFVRSHAAAALGRIGPNARKAIPGLRWLLKDEDPFVRSHAAAAIMKIEPPDSRKSEEGLPGQGQVGMSR